jgi:hypothetical protein
MQRALRIRRGGNSRGKDSLFKALMRGNQRCGADSRWLCRGHCPEEDARDMSARDSANFAGDICGHR